MTEKTVDATFYVQVEPEHARWAPAGSPPAVTGAHATKITRKRPAAAAPSGSVTVKLTLRLPAAVFEPLAPAATVIIPAELIHSAPVQVTAEDPAAP